MITACAPAAVALRAFCANPHRPRSTSAIFPEIAAALVNAEQPSVDVPPASTASSAATTFADTVGFPMAGPKAAVPNWKGPAIDAGVSTCTVGLPRTSTEGACSVTRGLSSTTRPNLVADATRSALVICGQNLFSVLSNSIEL